MEFLGVNRTKDIISIVLLLFLIPMATPKWVEGVLKTSKNWAFLARFCFLSYDGQFEYQIEFNPEIGLPNLLLYYDDESQWPSVYHSDKTCQERETVLNKAGQNQLIPLSHWYPDSEYSGCVLKSLDQDVNNNSPTPKPTPKSKNKTVTKLPKPRLPNDPNATTQDPRYFDQFLKTTQTVDETSTSSTDATSESGQELMDYEIKTKNYSSSYDVETIDGFTEITLITNVREGNQNDSDIVANLEDVETMFSPSEKKGDIVKRNSRSEQYYDRTKTRKFDPSPPRPKGPMLPGNTGRLIVTCHNARRFRSVRERWWFIAISNCGENKGLDVKYRFLMTNGPPGDYWHEHFSADEFYVLPILIAFSFAYLLTSIALVICSVELKSRQLLHTTYKMFLASVGLQQIGIFMQSLAYVRYAVNGIGGNSAKTLGQLLCGFSEITYLLLLVLMAKGYTITRARLKVGFTVKLTVFICCYFITYIALFIYQAQEFDPGEVLYLYESPAGYGLIVLRIAAWFMFIYAIIFTIKKYPEKGVFYYPFSLCGSLWFHAGPLFILTATNYIDKWVRESVVTAVLLFIAFAGHVTFLLLTLPTFANKNFPYHVRTTQIGVMEAVGMVAGNSTVDHFSHHIYNPHNSVIIPLTRRTEQLIGGVNHYMASAPPLHMLSPLTSPVTPNSNGTAISYISGGIVDSLNINNIGPKLSISTQHSNESTDNDYQKNITEENRSDSLENRFVPPKLMNDHLVRNGDINKNEILNSNLNLQHDEKENKGSVFYIDNPDRLGSNLEEYSYKDDPNYIKDINNPFLVGASMRSRRGLLEPIAKKEAYNIVPPAWSLAKNRKPPNDEKAVENGGKKVDTDYHLQGVIASFPLPQIPRSAGKTRMPLEDNNQDVKPEEVVTEENASSPDESLGILQPGIGDKLDDTLMALYSEKNTK